MATPIKTLPLDAARLGRPFVMMAGEIKANRDGEIKKDPVTGLPWWQYGIAVRVEGTRSAAVLTIQTPGEQAGIEEGMAVALVGLMASPWEMNDGSGIVFSASAIVPATSGTGPAASAIGPGSRAKAGDAT